MKAESGIFSVYTRLCLIRNSSKVSLTHYTNVSQTDPATNLLWGQPWCQLENRGSPAQAGPGQVVPLPGRMDSL